MSIWTHVAGVARIDDLRIDRIDLRLADLSAFDNPPTGSEGSLTVTIWANPHINHMDAYTVTVFGDLRNYDSPEEIVKWFQDACAKQEIIRMAVIVAECEDGRIERWDSLT